MTKKMSSVNRPLGYYELDPKFPWTIVSGKCATKLVLYRKLRFSFISAVRSFNYFFVAIIGYPGVFSEHLMLPRVTKSQPRSQGLSSSRSLEQARRDPGSGWSRVCQILAGYKLGV